ncbi:cytochrome-c peroxidase [Maribacter dokdonensis]|uniref:cytochrome-c peroxidase n=1 Tax=Maribacter dokdonensis TaxID=320912 RepID=UPI001C0883D3|nr:cytochrome c peroxidase [Maribacter dokdonensis]MBU2901866.1 methylamine utilization protein [Maribacter dokdonensis]
MSAFNYKWILIVFVCFFLSCKNEETKPLLAINANDQSMFNNAIREHYFLALDSTSYYMQQIDTAQSLSKNKELFLKSREWYKRVEPMLIAYDYENYISMNAPNLLKVEIDDHTDIKKQKPKSFQVLEELLYSEEGYSNEDLNTVLEYLKIRIPFVRKNHILITQRDRHHLKMIRDAIVNVATKGITGFDSPMLANSLNEAVYNYETLQTVLDIYKEAFRNNTLYKQWKKEISSTIDDLQSANFDEFDRYSFIRLHTNTQLELVDKTANDWGIELSQSRALDPKVTNLFDKNFFNMKMFSTQRAPDITEERIELGRQLFNDTDLSGSGTISCATCHIAEKAFTDGHKIAKGINGQDLQRNSPTLTYAVYQRSLFYDGRADGLEDQIVGVTNNENEFHIDLEKLEEKIQDKSVYKVQFDSLYDGKITDMNVRNAIATYIRSLAPFDSKFDRNMNNLEETMTTAEITGFNLFMGKAACATCHFPPAFNGTVPPKYMESEFENLGVPKNASFENPVLDDDWGQYYPYEVEEKKHFFKTSTVRNVELTGPYMHNGVYETLEEVVEFYNVGGGQGMGLDVPYQTLPPDSLHLTTTESKAIIAFMKTLTDKRFEKEAIN